MTFWDFIGLLSGLAGGFLGIYFALRALGFGEYLADARWYGIFSKNRFSRWYKVYMLLDEARKSVRYLEETGSITWRAGTKGLMPIINVNCSRSHSVAHAPRGTSLPAQPRNLLLKLAQQLLIVLNRLFSLPPSLLKLSARKP